MWVSKGGEHLKIFPCFQELPCFGISLNTQVSEVPGSCHFPQNKTPTHTDLGAPRVVILVPELTGHSLSAGTQCFCRCCHRRRRCLSPTVLTALHQAREGGDPSKKTPCSLLAKGSSSPTSNTVTKRTGRSMPGCLCLKFVCLPKAGHR